MLPTIVPELNFRVPVCVLNRKRAAEISIESPINPLFAVAKKAKHLWQTGLVRLQPSPYTSQQHSLPCRASTPLDRVSCAVTSDGGLLHPEGVDRPASLQGAKGVR